MLIIQTNQSKIIWQDQILKRGLFSKNFFIEIKNKSKLCQNIANYLP